jgi:hypothetical protein
VSVEAAVVSPLTVVVVVDVTVVSVLVTVVVVSAAGIDGASVVVVVSMSEAGTSSLSPPHAVRERLIAKSDAIRNAFAFID